MSQIAIEQLVNVSKEECLIIDSLARAKEATTQNLRNSVPIPKSTFYKLLGLLMNKGFITKEKGKLRTSFLIRIELVGGEEFSITPKNVKAFIAASEPISRAFINMYGVAKYLQFTSLYAKYVEGKIPVFLMAKKLKVPKSDVERLINEIEFGILKK
ncbi:MAG: helix-turn-helix domain-containing protein [Nitrososphaerales archaeon]